MAFAKQGLLSFGTGGSIANGVRRSKIWHYITNDALSAVADTGYFNAAAAQLLKGDVIFVCAAQSGTPAGEVYHVTATTASTVTIARFVDNTGA